MGNKEDTERILDTTLMILKMLLKWSLGILADEEEGTKVRTSAIQPEAPFAVVTVFCLKLT